MKKAFLFILTVALLLPVFPSAVFAANINISGFKMDSDYLNYGQICHINGSISSYYNLKTVEAIVYTSNGNFVTSSKDSNIGKPSYSIRSSKVDNGLSFGSISPGSYYLIVKATDTKGTSVSSSKFYFTIIGSLEINNLKIEYSSIYMGSGCNILGKITSKKNITKVRAVIERDKDFEGLYEEVGSPCVYNPKCKSIDIVSSPINSNLKFGNKAPGLYRVKVEAWDESGAKVTATSTTTIIRGVKIEANLATTTITKGCGCNVEGTIRTGSRITEAYGKIVQGNDTLYESKHITSGSKRKIDIKSSKINFDLPFGKLAKGSYTLVIYAKDYQGYEQTIRISFKVV